jgi:hypothetical protein
MKPILRWDIVNVVSSKPNRTDHLDEETLKASEILESLEMEGPNFPSKRTYRKYNSQKE